MMVCPPSRPSSEAMRPPRNTRSSSSAVAEMVASSTWVPTRPSINARVVLEAANYPVTPSGDVALRERGVTVIPDVLANAGGVTGSYFEWTQNIQQFTWKVERFNSELRDRLVTAFTDVNSFAKLHDCSLREAAYAIGLQRVSEATKLRGYLSGA